MRSARHFPARLHCPICTKLVAGKRPIQFTACIARFFITCYHLHLHDGAHCGGHEFTRYDIEVPNYNVSLIHSRDKGDESGPQGRVGLALNPFSAFEVCPNQDDVHLIEAPHDRIPATSIYHLMLHIVARWVYKHDASMGSAFGAFCSWLSHCSKTPGIEPLHGLEVVSFS